VHGVPPVTLSAPAVTRPCEAATPAPVPPSALGLADAPLGHFDFGNTHRFLQDQVAPAPPAPSRKVFVTMSREEENEFARYLVLKRRGMLTPCHAVISP